MGYAVGSLVTTQGTLKSLPHRSQILDGPAPPLLGIVKRPELQTNLPIQECQRGVCASIKVAIDCRTCSGSCSQA